MEFVIHLACAIVTFFLVLLSLLLLIKFRDNASVLGSVASKKDNWKRYDYIWYGSALFSLVVFATSYAINELEKYKSSYTQEARTNLFVVVNVVKTLDAYCKSFGLINSETIASGSEAVNSCLWLNGVSSTMEQLPFHPDYPLVNFASYSVNVDIDDFSEGEPLDLEGKFVPFTLEWRTITDNVDSSLATLIKYSSSNGENTMTLPKTSTIPDGYLIDHAIENAKEAGNQIAVLSPFNVRGLWWLYLFSILIAFKVAKTRAELIIK